MLHGRLQMTQFLKQHQILMEAVIRGINDFG